MEKSFGLRWRVSEKSSLATRGRVRTEPRRVLAGRLLAHSRGTSGRPALVFPPGHGPEMTRIGDGQWVGGMCKCISVLGCVCVSRVFVRVPYSSCLVVPELAWMSRLLANWCGSGSPPPGGSDFPPG